MSVHLVNRTIAAAADHSVDDRSNDRQRRGEMKLTTQKEFVAIPIVVVMLGALFVIFAAADVGLWAWLVVGVVGLVVCALLVRRTRENTAIRGAGCAAHRADA
jgi:F0F1-type ATP synthase assembly protein I